MGWQTIRARFTGRCQYAGCPYGGKIAAGELIVWQRRGKISTAYHADCYGADTNEQAPAETIEQAPAEPTAAPVAVDALAGFAQALAPLVATHVKASVDGLSAELFEQIDEHVRAVAGELIEPAALVLKVNELPAVRIEHAHPLLPKLTARLQQRRHVYLWGPPGSGKSHASRQVAHVLGLDFGYISLNPMSSPTRVEGFVDAHGRFVDTQFCRLYESGGVFCFDELDNANPALLTALNAALENGVADIGGRLVTRHPDFVCVATGNTPGRGGTWGHADRRTLDCATSDRFYFIHWPVDEKTERARALAVCPTAGPWVDWCHRLRAYVADRSNGIQNVYVTPRGTVNGAADLAQLPADLEPLADIAEGWFFKGVGAETVARVLAACPLPNDPREQQTQEQAA